MGSEATEKGNENNQGNEAAAVQREPKKAGILQNSVEKRRVRKDMTEFTKS